MAGIAQPSSVYIARSIALYSYIRLDVYVGVLGLAVILYWLHLLDEIFSSSLEIRECEKIPLLRTVGKKSLYLCVYVCGAGVVAVRVTSSFGRARRCKGS